jgi:enamine deaminase RidA (YjgF/YER057c/UK114 family)
MRRRDFLSTGLRASLTTALAAATTVPLPGCRPRSPAAVPQPPALQLRPIAPSPELAYAHAVEITGAQRLLFISGQVPADEDERVPADYPSQYRLAWANVEKRLAAAGMTFDNLVKATIYLSDRRYIAESRGLRASVLGARTPAITIILTGIYDEAWLLEIEAIAAA